MVTSAALNRCYCGFESYLPSQIYCPIVYLVGRLTLNQESAVRTLVGHPEHNMATNVLQHGQKCILIEDGSIP